MANKNFEKYSNNLFLGPIVGGLVNKYGCRPVCIAGKESSQ